MTNSVTRQRGLTFISLVFILAFLAFLVLLLFKIAPIYMNHSKVVNALEAVENMTDVETMSKFDINVSLQKRFNMNYVEHITDDDITIKKQGGYLKLEIEYERVVKIVGNLSVLVEFYDFIEVGAE